MCVCVCGFFFFFVPTAQTIISTATTQGIYTITASGITKTMLMQTYQATQTTQASVTTTSLKDDDGDDDVDADD